jgi:hypothetical protein
VSLTGCHTGCIAHSDIPQRDHRPASTWPSGRSLHGGVDEIPLPAGVDGRLWLCGKHFVAPAPEAALAEITPDPVVTLAEIGRDPACGHAVVCLCEPAELSNRYPDYVEWLRGHQPERALWWPIPDLHAPSADEAAEWLALLRSRLQSGQTLLVHCGAGIGRAGTVAAGLLITLGVPMDEAVAPVAAHRPMAGPEAGAQTDLLHALATRHVAEPF